MSDAGVGTLTRRTQGVGIALVGAGAVSVQFGGAVAVTLFDRVGAAGAVTLRLVIASVLLLLGTAVARLVVRSHRGTFSGRTRREWATVLAFGVALAAMNLSFYESIARIPLGPAVSIEMLGPLTLAAVSSRRWLDGLWIVVALGGVVTLGLGESHDAASSLNVSGVAFAALAGACWAVYIVLSARTAAIFPRTDGLTVAMLVAAVLVLPAGLAGVGADALLAWPALWRGAAIALLSSGVPYSLDLFALRRITPATFGVLMSLEPAIASVAGLVVIGQVLTPVQWVGLVLVVAACAGVTVFSNRRTGAPRRASADRRDPLDDPATVEAV
ncbi:EamA family transporter [Jatrophihabitans sp. YIM 134969]